MGDSFVISKPKKACSVCWLPVVELETPYVLLAFNACTRFWKLTERLFRLLPCVEPNSDFAAGFANLR